LSWQDFLKKIGDELLHLFPNRIINIHPALLPNYGGKGMYGRFVHEAVWTQKRPKPELQSTWLTNIMMKGPF